MCEGLTLATQQCAWVNKRAPPQGAHQRKLQHAGALPARRPQKAEECVLCRMRAARPRA